MNADSFSLTPGEADERVCVAIMKREGGGCVYKLVLWCRYEGYRAPLLLAGVLGETYNGDWDGSKTALEFIRRLDIAKPYGDGAYRMYAMLSDTKTVGALGCGKFIFDFDYNEWWHDGKKMTDEDWRGMRSESKVDNPRDRQ